MNEIGNQVEAGAALRIVLGLQDPRRDELSEPGWVRVGQGTTRIALRAPSGAVYKVPCPLRPNWEDGMRHNRREAANFTIWAGRDFVPQWYLYEVLDADGKLVPRYLYEVLDADGKLVPIMAMEFVENDGTEPTNLEELRAALKEVSAEDLHPDNYRVRDGRAIIIDAGGPAKESTPCFLPDHLLRAGRAAGLGGTARSSSLLDVLRRRR